MGQSWEPLERFRKPPFALLQRPSCTRARCPQGGATPARQAGPGSKVARVSVLARSSLVYVVLGRAYQLRRAGRSSVGYVSTGEEHSACDSGTRGDLGDSNSVCVLQRSAIRFDDCELMLVCSAKNVSAAAINASIDTIQASISVRLAAQTTQRVPTLIRTGLCEANVAEEDGCYLGGVFRYRGCTVS
eukprot:3941860-Rhodomonas_salina.1